MAWARGEHSRAEALCADGLALAGDIDAPAWAACLTRTLGLVAHAAGDDDGARRCFEDAIAELTSLPADMPPIFPALGIGLVMLTEGPLGRPRMMFEDTVFHFRGVGLHGAIGYTLADLASLLRTVGLHDEAGPLLHSSLARFQATDDRNGISFALNQLGCHARSIGELELSRERLDEALALRVELGDRRPVSMALSSLDLLDARAGDPQRARELLHDATRRFEASDDLAGLAGMYLNIGAVEMDAGRFDQAAAAYERARDLWAPQRLPRAVGWATLSLGDAIAAMGDGDLAAVRYDEALRSFERYGDARGIAAVAAVAQPPLSAR
jgi:tetratricopeptide (TPR) repeat protein